MLISSEGLQLVFELFLYFYLAWMECFNYLIIDSVAVQLPYIEPKQD